jgi:putative phosphotransacetylase
MRESGKHDGTPGCTIVGPKGTVEIKQGVIDPQRHLHLSDDEAKAWGFEKGDVISFFIEGPQAATFHNAVVRTHPTFRLNVHLDTDEGNACSLKTTGGKAKLVKIVRGGDVVWQDETVS